jgi:hypothetical protein
VVASHTGFGSPLSPESAASGHPEQLATVKEQRKKDNVRTVAVKERLRLRDEGYHLFGGSKRI